MENETVIGPVSTEPNGTCVPGVDANGRKVDIWSDGNVSLGGLKGDGFDTEAQVTADRNRRQEAFRLTATPGQTTIGVAMTPEFRKIMGSGYENSDTYTPVAPFTPL